MKRAARAAPLAVIIGDDEAERQMVTLKPLREHGEQVQVNADEAAAIIRSANFSTT